MSTPYERIQGWMRDYQGSIRRIKRPRSYIGPDLFEDLEQLTRDYHSLLLSMGEMAQELVKTQHQVNHLRKINSAILASIEEDQNSKYTLQSPSTGV